MRNERLLKKIVWMLAVVLLTACGMLQHGGEATGGQGTGTSQAQQAVVDDTHWHIDITSMNSLRYGNKMVTPDFFLEMRGDTLQSYLPYLGQAFRSDYGSTEGVLDFELPVKNLQVSRPKKYMKRLEMDVWKRQELLHYTVELNDDGGAFVRVRSNDRDPISFDGNIEH